MINKKYNIEITVLSPLAIGAGAEKDWVKGMDFVEKDDKIYLLNMGKLVTNGINPQDLTTFFANKDSAGLLRKIEGKLNAVSDKVMTLPTSSGNDIKSFIKNELSGKPIIPGSSLKGAVRSIILDYLLNGNKPRQLNEKDYFGDSNKGDELMRFIKFSDAEFEDTALVNTKIFNLHGHGNDWQGGWKHSSNNTNSNYQPNGFNTLYESILPQLKSVSTVMLSETVFNKTANQSYFSEKQQLFSIHELFNIINGHTYDYISKEIDFFNKYNQAENTQKIINSLTAISNQIPDEADDVQLCILKMSAGSGFHSITGDWQYDDYSNTGTWREGRNAGKQKCKSRKVAIYSNNKFSLMGFVSLRVIEEKLK